MTLFANHEHHEHDHHEAGEAHEEIAPTEKQLQIIK
jgi:hypothetical protein